ncbi:MAG: WD40/YVTN/BNR-like repeat-containing protein [Burkholderiales bacterium]
MNNKLLIPVFVVGAIAVGYFLGVSNKSTNTPADTSATKTVMSHDEGADVGNAVIPGAHHIHAITYNAKGNLLLGTHGGLFESTDGGKTWQKVSVKGSVNADDWMSLVVDPRNRKIIVAGGHDLGVIKSIDGGITWMRSDDGIKGTDIHGLAIDQRSPELLFAYSVDNGVFKSKDGGVSWKRMDDGPGNPGVRSFEYMAVQTSMDKSMGWDNWGVLLAGTADGVFQSFSCFCGWTKTTKVFDNTTVYTLTTLHKDLTVMYAGTQTGAWKTIDAGQNWKKLDGLNGIKITAIAINPENSKELTVSSEDGIIYRSSNTGESWQRIN